MVFKKLTLSMGGKSGEGGRFRKGMHGKRVILDNEFHLGRVFHQHLLE